MVSYRRQVPTHIRSGRNVHTSASDNKTVTNIVRHDSTLEAMGMKIPVIPLSGVRLERNIHIRDKIVEVQMLHEDTPRSWEDVKSWGIHGMSKNINQRLGDYVYLVWRTVNVDRMVNIKTPV